MDSSWNEVIFSLLTPMFRVFTGLILGLFVASFIEGMQWTHHLARAAAPLIRKARLGDIPAAAFALAFFSTSSANALLGEAHARGELSSRELLLSNIFNSLPSWMTHTPGVFFLTWPVIGNAALIYTGITLLAAASRTLLTVFLGRVLLPPLPDNADVTPASLPDAPSPRSAAFWKKGLQSASRRFRRRLPRLLLVAVPLYILLFFLQRGGFFEEAEQWIAVRITLPDVLPPEALGVMVLYMIAELGTSVVAAGSLLQGGTLSTPEVVLALLIGNVLATPMRAIRHQIPAYASFFPAALGLKLILLNQGLRAASMIVMIALYWSIAC